jgi:hypothetical protein
MTRIPTRALVALAFVCAMTLAFGVTDASAVSVSAQSVTVVVDDTGVKVDVGAATPPQVAQPPTDPPPAVDHASTASVPMQPAEELSEVVQAAAEPNPYAGSPELSAQSTTPDDVGRDRAAADTRPSGDPPPDRASASEPGRAALAVAAVPRAGVLAPTSGSSAAPIPAPAPDGSPARRGDHRSGGPGRHREHHPDGTAQSPVPPIAAPSGGGSASATSGGGGALAATLVVLLGFAASPAYSPVRTPKHRRRAPDVARALECPG